MTDPRFQDLAELSRRMTSSLDLRALTEDLVSWAIRETGAATAAITLWDRERNVLMALTHLEIADLGLKVPSGEVYARLDKYPATRKVLEERQALSVEVGHPTENLGEQKWLREHDLSAAMVLPLVTSGQAIGTMEIARADGPFSEDDVSYCQLLCDMAGSAVQNAKLHGELRSTLAQYQSLIERLPAVTYLDDLETGASQFVSPQVEELFGITQEEWLASPDAWLATVHPDDRERAGKAFAGSMDRRNPLREEYRVVSPDERVRWLLDQTVLLPGGDGHPALAQGMIFDISDSKLAERELIHRANHDPLTGLPNRDQFRSRLDAAILHARGSGGTVAVLYVDLDDFKLVNDSFGHEAGDELLTAIAGRLRGSTRASDIVGRDGGDEFLLLMADLPGVLSEATAVAAQAA